jgi:hypothetical protein
MQETKGKEKTWNKSGENILLWGANMRITYNSSPGTTQAKREWKKPSRAKYHQPRVLYPVKFSFIFEKEIKIFPHKNGKNMLPVDSACKKC